MDIRQAGMDIKDIKWAGMDVRRAGMDRTAVKTYKTINTIKNNLSEQ